MIKIKVDWARVFSDAPTPETSPADAPRECALCGGTFDGWQFNGMHRDSSAICWGCQRPRRGMSLRDYTLADGAQIDRVLSVIDCIRNEARRQ